MVAMNAAAMPPKPLDIPIQQLVDLIAEGAHWDKQNLADAGLDELFADTEEDEEIGGVFQYFVYGKNVKVLSVEGWDVEFDAVAPHGFAISVQLDTDNSTILYFHEEADCDAFMECVKQSSRYRTDEHHKSIEIGTHLIERVDVEDGWKVVYLHGG